MRGAIAAKVRVGFTNTGFRGVAMVQQNDSPISRIFMAYEPSYWRGILCTLASLARHAVGQVTVEIIIRHEHRNSLENILKKVLGAAGKSLSVNIIEMGKAALKECDSLQYTNHFKAEICFRMFYFDISKQSGNAVYIDIDTIFRTSLAELAAAMPTNLPLAARAQPSCTDSILAISPQHTNYFNSGVLLFNVESFGMEIDQRMRDSRRIMHDISGISSFLDQDALNLAFCERWSSLPARFNYMSIDTEVLNENAGAILHATGSRKPWMLGSGHRYSAQYAEEMAALGMPPWRRYDVNWIFDRVGKRIRKVVGKGGE
jgi:lipopolysaccharide biosynthesis glycosyltransferase